MSYDHWKTTEPEENLDMSYEDWQSDPPPDEELCARNQTTPGQSKPSDLEAAAIDLHDFLWENIGSPYDDEWPLSVIGAEDALPEFTRRLNALQDAIKASGYAHRDYCPKPR